MGITQKGWIHPIDESTLFSFKKSDFSVIGTQAETAYSCSTGSSTAMLKLSNDSTTSTAL